MRCRECGYVRHPADSGPQSKCPSCGAEYPAPKAGALSVEEFEKAQQRAAERLEAEARRMEEASRPPDPVVTRNARLVTCLDCDGAISRHAVACPHCGRPLANARQPVEIMNIKMEFEAMVWFIVKWALASIPAAIILFLIGYLLLLVIGWRSF